MQRVTSLLVSLASLCLAASIGLEYHVKRSTNEWSGKAYSTAYAAVLDYNSVGDRLVIGALKSDSTPSAYGGWMLTAYFDGYGGAFARVRMKVTYSDSSTSVLLDAGDEELQAVYIEPVGGCWGYLSAYIMHSDVLKDATKLVVFFDNFSNGKFTTPYWIFGATELRELRKVAVHEF